MKYTILIPQIVYRDIAVIQDYIALDNPIAAKKTARKLFQAIEDLEDSPIVGFQLRNKFPVETDLWARIVTPYIVLFKIEKDLIKIYRVLDGRSDYLVRLGLANPLENDDQQ